MHRVAAAGCDAVQGYLISRPVPRDRLPEAIVGASMADFACVPGGCGPLERSSVRAVYSQWLMHASPSPDIQRTNHGLPLN